MILRCAVTAGGFLFGRVLEQHWEVVEPMSTRADWVSYHYYVGLLKISEDKVSRSIVVDCDRSSMQYTPRPGIAKLVSRWPKKGTPLAIVVGIVCVNACAMHSSCADSLTTCCCRCVDNCEADYKEIQCVVSRGTEEQTGLVVPDSRHTKKQKQNAPRRAGLSFVKKHPT